MVQQRYVICGMNILALTVGVGTRFVFSMILAQMVFIPNLNPTSIPNDEIICPVNEIQETSLDNRTRTILNINDDRFKWPQETQGIIQSSFNWGYSIAMFSSGMLVQKYGGKLVLLVSLFLSAIIIVLTPMAVAYGDVIGLVIARALTGLFQAPIYPCLSAFSIAWYPVEQRGRFSALIATGFGIGGFIVSYFTGIILGHIERWDFAFYFHGCIIILYCILIPFLIYDRPQIHPFIGENEKKMLVKKIDYLNDKSNLPTPWRKILASRPFIALCIAATFRSWSSNVINYDLPKYLNDVLHISMKKNALYSSLPFILVIITYIIAGFLSDWMVRKSSVSLTNIRKIFVAVSSIIPGIFLVAASYAECDEMQVIIYFMFASSIAGFNLAGTKLNVMDLAPNFAPPLYGLMISFEMFSAIISQYIIHVLTPNAYLSEWRIVLWLSFGFCTIITIIYTLFGSAKIQQWNTPKEDKDIETKDVTLS